MNIPPSLRESRPGRRDRPLEIYAMQAGPAGLEVPVHWHDHAEILLMQAGELALTVEGEPRTGRPGDVFYLNPRALHGMRSPGPECRYLAFVFPLPWLGFAQADEAEDYLRPLAEGSARVATQLPPDSAAASVRRWAEYSAGSGDTDPSNHIRSYSCTPLIYFIPGSAPEAPPALSLSLVPSINANCEIGFS